VKTCVEFVFEKFGSLWYNTWTIVLIACLWLVSSVDTTQAHIYYIYSHPNLSQIKFLAHPRPRFRGSRNSKKISRRFRVSRKLRTCPGVSGSLGYKYPFSPRSISFHCFSPLTGRLPHSRRLPSLPHTAPRRFSSPPSKSSVSEGLRASRCGDQRSTSVSKD
jgi:hypothetical protein